MTDPMITPPVPQDVIDSLATGTVTQDAEKALSVAQRLVKADKRAAVAGAVHVAVLLVTALGMHLSARDVAELGSIVSLGLTYFVAMNIRKQ